MCSGSSRDIAISHLTRRFIEIYDQAIERSVQGGATGSEVLQLAQNLTQAVTAEFPGVESFRLARLYYDLFQMLAAHGDKAAASGWARKVYEQRVILGGDDSPEAQRMKSLAEDPERHQMFGMFRILAMLGM